MLSAISVAGQGDQMGIAVNGRGTQLAKMDITSAYRKVPVHPEDRPLLAVQWAGQVFLGIWLPGQLQKSLRQ